jgi:NADPH2:quinone reductase
MTAARGDAAADGAGRRDEPPMTGIGEKQQQPAGTSTGHGTIGERRPIGSRPMKAVQIVELSGPQSALQMADLPEPEPSHMLTPGAGVVVEVHAAGVSFPEVLQTRGEYQLKPPLPFVPGSEVGGVVRSATDGADVKPGDRVAAFCMLGGFAETAVAPEYFTFAVPDSLDFAQAASLVLNYHTAYFALVLRGRLKEGETVLVHGAAGGVGTAVIQVANGLGARTIGVVSSDEKERVAREAGAGDVLRADGPWKDEAKQLGGADIVLDPVGGERFIDSLRSLREGGRVVVVGFTGGSIPEVRVNRLLLGNTEVVGAGWGAYVMSKPEVTREIGRAIGDLIDRGFVRPIVGERHPLERAADALTAIDERRATGKVVLDVR